MQMPCHYVTTGRMDAIWKILNLRETYGKSKSKDFIEYVSILN